MKVRRKKQQTDSQYATVFDFLFMPIDKKMKGARDGVAYPSGGPLSGLAKGLYEIASEPVLYPFSVVFNDMEGELDTMFPLYEAKTKGKTFAGGEGTRGLNMSVGLGSFLGAMANPRGVRESAMRKFRNERKWARVGGFTNGTMDGALFSLWGKKLGLNVGTAVQVGKSFTDDVFDDQSRGEMLDRAVSLTVERAHRSKGAKREDLEQVVQKAAKEKDKKKRVQVTVDEMKKKGLAEDDAREIALMFWGKEGDDDDLGLFDDGKADAKILAKQAAFSLLGHQANKTGDTRREKKIESFLKGLETGEAVTPGARLGKTLLRGRWLRDGVIGGGFFQAFASGRLDKLRLGEHKDVVVYKSGSPQKDDGGKDVKKKLWSPTTSFRGSIPEIAYYAHPVNLLKGMFWNGEVWLRLAKKGDKIDGDSFFYSLHQLAPVQFMKPVTEWFQENVMERIMNKIISKAAFETIQSTIRRIITRIIGSAVPGVGLIITAISELIGDQLYKILMDIALLILLGIALIPILFLGVTGLGQYSQNNLESPVEIEVATGNQNQDGLMDNPVEVTIEGQTD